jgi:hypothetical protein
LKVTDLLETAQKLPAIPRRGKSMFLSLPIIGSLAETASPAVIL